MLQLNVRPIGEKLVPASVRDLDRIKGLDPHQTFRVSMLDRSPVEDESRRHYWRLLQYVGDGLGMDFHVLHAELKLKVGYVANIYFSAAFPGGLHYELVSTKKPLMGSVAWEEYKLLAVNVLFEHYLPGVRRADVLREVDRMVERSRG